MATELTTIHAGLVAGGDVGSIVPQTYDEVMRVAAAIIKGGLAPSSLSRQKTPEEKQAAVAIIIMTGLELGLKPMAAMRSLTVINNRPAAYGEGRVAIVRKSGRARRVDMGTVERGGQLVGYCEAERADTGEAKRVEFSEQDAKNAGLWDDRPMAPKREWINGQPSTAMAPNESPWHRYPKRMLMWRAAGYCLGDLFADVLFGLEDEFTAAEIGGGETIVAGPPIGAPPPPPAPPAALVIESSIVAAAPDGAEAPAESLVDLLARLDEEMALAGDEASIEQAWADADADAAFAADEHMAGLARRAKARHLARVAKSEQSAPEAPAADAAGAGAGHASTGPAAIESGRVGPSSHDATGQAAAGDPPAPAAAAAGRLSEAERATLTAFATRLVPVIGKSPQFVVAEANRLNEELRIPAGLAKDKARSIRQACCAACDDYAGEDKIAAGRMVALVAGIVGCDESVIADAYRRSRA